MINHKYKFIFLHIPKTGGMSIGQTLNIMLDDYTRYQGFNIHYDKFDKNLFQDYFVFTFVRNPWDRFYSQYKFKEFLYEHSLSYVIDNLEDLWVDFYYPQEEVKDSKTFLEHFEYNNIPDQFKHKPNFTLSSYIGENIHLASQTKFLNGHYSGNIDKFPYIDFIGRFENLQEDFNFICNKIGLPLTKLLHINKSKPKTLNFNSDLKYDKVFTEKEKEALKNRFEDDIKTFNYSFN